MTTNDLDPTTERIRHAALDSFNRVGFGSTTIDDIAASAGVGVATIYRRWPDKAALANDLYGTAIGRMEELFGRVDGATPKQRFRSLWAAFHGFATEEPAWLLFVEGQAPASFITDENRRRKERFEVMAAEVLIDVGVGAAPEVASAMVLGTLVTATRTGAEIDADELGERLWLALRARSA